MSVEQRLQDAFRQLDRVEPSPDLWTRVVHSIEEDRTHRHRVVVSVAATLAVLAALVAVGALALRDGPFGTYVDRPVLEALEIVGLTALVVVLGPAIRRFGRHYAEDLFVVDHPLATSMLRLLDLAYYLVFAAYVLLTTQFEFELAVAARPASLDLAQQLHEAAVRVGGLLLLMGVLHALTLFALPFVALIHNSTRRRRPLPTWLRAIGLVIGAAAALQLIGVLLGLLVAGMD